MHASIIELDPRVKFELPVGQRNTSCEHNIIEITLPSCSFVSDSLLIFSVLSLSHIHIVIKGLLSNIGSTKGKLHLLDICVPHFLDDLSVHGHEEVHCIVENVVIFTELLYTDLNSTSELNVVIASTEFNTWLDYSEFNL